MYSIVMFLLMFLVLAGIPSSRGTVPLADRRRACPVSKRDYCTVRSAVCLIVDDCQCDYSTVRTATAADSLALHTSHQQRKVTKLKPGFHSNAIACVACVA